MSRVGKDVEVQAKVETRQPELSMRLTSELSPNCECGNRGAGCIVARQASIRMFIVARVYANMTLDPQFVDFLSIQCRSSTTTECREARHIEPTTSNGSLC